MLTDAMLSGLTRFGPEPLRRWAARKAADRGMHWVALKAAGDDPYVLAALGLFHLAVRSPATDAKAGFGRILAEAALSGALPTASATGLDSRQSRRLARALAPVAPALAADLLSEEAALDRAACLVAAGDIDQAAALVEQERGREAHLLAAHIALSREQYRAGRAAWNAAFAFDGLAPVIEETDDPVTAEALSSEAGDLENGPKISVVVPYRNAVATLGQALESLCRQSWRNVEILAIDDGSDDEGPQIAGRMAADDARIVPLKNEGGSGVYGARNQAIERASGEFVTFLDADDWSPAERLARQVAALRNGAAVSIANHVRIDETGRPTAPRVFPLARPVPITLMIRRDALLAAGPFEEVATGADSEMLGRLQRRFGRKAIARDPAILLVARWRAGSLSEAREGGLFGEERLAYRADWMFRHAGLAPPLASAGSRGLETAGMGSSAD